MFEVLPVAIYATDAQGCLTYFNPAAVRFSGRTPEIGTDKWCITWKLYLPDGTPLPHDQCPMALALKGQDVPTGIECVAERPDGTRLWFTPCPAVIRDERGRIIGGINLLMDITDRKNAEIEAGEQFRAIVETTPECVKIVAPDGTLLFMNAPGLSMVDAAKAEDVIGKSVYDLVAEEHREKFRDFNARVCGGEKASLEFDIVGLAGSHRNMESHAAPLRHVDGSTVHLAITRDITERKRAEGTGFLLSAIVDSSDDAIVSKDLNGVITSWNWGAERLFGYTASEAIGRPVTMLIPQDRLDEEPQILARLKRGERVDHFETVRRRKDGALLEISLTISPVRNAQGVVIGASKIARDISDRKRTERAIQALNSQLTADLAAMSQMQQLSTRLVQVDDFQQLLQEILRGGMEITGADMGNIQLLEGGVLKIAAHSGFETHFLDFFETVQNGDSVCGLALQRGERVIVEDVARSPVFAGKASLSAVLGAGVRAVQSTPLISRSGEVVGLLSTHYRRTYRPADRDLQLLDILARQTADLIERKRAEATLRASEAEFRQLANAMPQIVWTARPDGHVDYYNDRWYEFIGSDRESFSNESWAPLVHPDEVDLCMDTWRRCTKSGDPYHVEARLLDRREHRWRWFMVRALPVRNERGEIVKWYGSCTDIDQQKGVQEDLRRANEDLEQFAFSASHDLQEPLRAIKIYSELLGQRFGPGLEPDALVFIRYLRNGATRMEALLRDLLTYTQAAKTEVIHEEADANRALNAALGNLASAIAEAGASIRSEPLPSLPVHAMHLQQIFQNLIGNALKYRSPDRPPVVQITAESDGSFWTFSVIDNGIGVPAEYKETIFGLFKRLHTSDAYSGTGIGLAICQRIVDRYHGRIWVESETAAGSTFRFKLPV